MTENSRAVAESFVRRLAEAGGEMGPINRTPVRHDGVSLYMGAGDVPLAYWSNGRLYVRQDPLPHPAGQWRDLAVHYHKFLTETIEEFINRGILLKEQVRFWSVF